MLNKIKKFKYNAFLIAIIATAWFLFRVITKPSRAFYPCQRIALSQVAFYWGSVFVPFIFPFYQQVMKIVNNNYQKVIKIVVAFIVGVIVFQTYQSYHESNLKEKGSRTIQKTFSASMLANTYTNSDRFDNKSTKQTQSPSLVSFYYDPLVYYGLIPPYDKQQNPAYNLVWKTVSELSLGDTLNPLRELINDGDTVLIKPNLISDNGAAYTHPAVVRPLIDMAVLSGAYKVYVGDGGPGYTSTEEIITNTNYRDMVNLLQDIYPENEIEVVNLNDRTNWHWINLGGNSAFAGSGYSDYDLGASFGETLFNHGYYSSSDPQGINPGGEVAGWYAVNDVVLNSDVIINVPKMKNHWTMMVTLCLKNQVGSTLCSTYDNGTSNWSRIPHCKTGTRFDGNIYYFNNDIFWRSILDVNKILIYVDKNGILNTEKQRKYLNVLDGIIANEKNAGGDNPYNSHFLLAGIDPVAIDAVACRLMGYDFDAIPGIKNVTNESTYPIGINDPKKIVVVGHEINSNINHIFEHGDGWKYYTDLVNLDLADFSPPNVATIDIVGDLNEFNITTTISDGLTAFIFCQSEDAPYIFQLTKEGEYYSAQKNVSNARYQLITQDKHFNTKFQKVINAYTDNISSDKTESIICGNTGINLNFSFLPGGKVTAYKYFCEVPNNGPQILPYYWEILSDMQNETFTVEVNFGYDEAELVTNGINENDLVICYFDEGWHPMATTVDIENNTVSSTTNHFTKFSIGTENIVPVELTYFSVVSKNGSIKLNWKTETESNLYGFDIEKSLDGKKFMKIGFVKGFGTTSIAKEYYFWDKDLASGCYFYRLKIIDNDGSFEYSQIVEYPINKKSDYLLYQNYPNPFNSETKIIYKVGLRNFVKITIYNQQGQKITTLLNETKSPGIYEVKWNGKDLNGKEVVSGVYLCNMRIGDLFQNMKMTILK